MAVDCTGGPEIFDKIQKGISGLEIGVLGKAVPPCMNC